MGKVTLKDKIRGATSYRYGIVYLLDVSWSRQWYESSDFEGAYR